MASIFQFVAFRCWYFSAFLLSLMFPSDAVSDHAELTNTGNTSLSVIQLIQFNDIPWGMSFLNHRVLLITLKRGKLVMLDLQTMASTPIQGAPDVIDSGQGGLMDIQTLPRTGDIKQSTPWIYFTYAKPLKDGKAVTALARAQLIGDQLTTWETIFEANNPSKTAKHYGSRIAFDSQGHVFLSIGDRGDRQSAQDLKSHGGTIVRLNLDGSIPSDNPFVARQDADPAIWSYGHRNPQGLFYDVSTHTLWASEHGPRGGDEINLIERGRNYGWPKASFGYEYWGPIRVGDNQPHPEFAQPRKVFSPSIAPSDLIRYHGELFHAWQNDFLSTSLAQHHLNRTQISPEKPILERRYFVELNERMRSIVEAPDGAILLSTDSGKILRVTPQ